SVRDLFSRFFRVRRRRECPGCPTACNGSDDLGQLRLSSPRLMRVKKRPTGSAGDRGPDEGSQHRRECIGSYVCSTLLSDPLSPERPCASLSLHLHQV